MTVSLLSVCVGRCRRESERGSEEASRECGFHCAALSPVARCGYFMSLNLAWSPPLGEERGIPGFAISPSVDLRMS